MRHGSCRLGEMADGAFAKGPVFPLPAQEFDGVIGLIGAGNGMGTVMASRATDPFMTGGLPVQGLVLNDLGVAVVTATPRFIEPGIWILGDLGHGPMTIDAGHPFPEHGISETLGDWAGVALIAAVHSVRDFTAMLFMHGLGEIGQAGHPGCSQGVGGMAIGAEDRPAVH